MKPRLAVLALPLGAAALLSGCAADSNVSYVDPYYSPYPTTEVVYYDGYPYRGAYYHHYHESHAYPHRAHYSGASHRTAAPTHAAHATAHAAPAPAPGGGAPAPGGHHHH